MIRVYFDRMPCGCRYADHSAGVVPSPVNICALSKPFNLPLSLEPFVAHSSAAVVLGFDGRFVGRSRYCRYGIEPCDMDAGANLVTKENVEAVVAHVAAGHR